MFAGNAMCQAKNETHQSSKSGLMAEKLYKKLMARQYLNVEMLQKKCNKFAESLKSNKTAVLKKRVHDVF